VGELQPMNYQNFDL